MAKIKLLTQEQAHYFFDYKDGILYWKNVLKYTNLKIGSKAGNIKNDNRCVIGLMGTTFYASRIVFLWHNGYMPNFVDHIDRNTLNNLIGNLREATNSQNQANKTKSINKTSIYKGVHFTKVRNGTSDKIYEYWNSLIYVNGKTIRMGNFKSEREAALIYNKAAVRHFGEFANLNIIQP